MSTSQRVTLEIPSPEREQDFTAAVRRSRILHGAFMSPPETRSQYRKYLARLELPTHRGFFICTESGELAGVVNVNEIVRGLFQSGYLGYYAFEPFAGKGFLSEGLRLVIRRAFRRERLHRLEANIQPGNARSIELVKALGFRLEGFSPHYLKIAGRYRDHERWAITVEDWKARRTQPRAASKSDEAEPPPRKTMAELKAGLGRAVLKRRERLKLARDARRT